MLSAYLKYLIYFISGSILITAVTIIAERKSPKIAGIMMSLPIITFLSLLFLAVSQGVYFASKAAIWNPIGSIADLVYMGLFAIGVMLPEYIGKNKTITQNTDENEKTNARNVRIKEVFFGLLFGFTGYFFFILALSRFSVTSGWVSLVSLWVAAIISYTLFRRLHVKIVERVRSVSIKEILFRGLFGGSVVAAVVILGDSIGYMWGGLFSSFPGSITPVLVLLHLKSGKDLSYGVIKSAPIGLSGTGLYSCMVWLLYPAYGIIVGTVISYLAVFIFLSVVFFPRVEVKKLKIAGLPQIYNIQRYYIQLFKR